jgi:hypothetical protein
MYFQEKFSFLFRRLVRGTPALRVLAALLAAGALPAAESGPLRAGAAKVDITPHEGTSLRMSGYANRKSGHTGVHDPLWVRALVLDNGHARALLLVADLIGFSHEFVREMTPRISRETGLAEEAVFLVATHTHGAPAVELKGEEATWPGQAAYTEQVKEALVRVAAEAWDRLASARIGAGVGRANVNINRVARWSDGSWFLGLNPDGPSDKTVAVVKVESPSGSPIAILFNYAMHGTALGQENTRITGDAPGAAARFVEQAFGGRAVALFTSGAAGDQAPLYDLSPGNFAGAGHVGALLGQEVVRVATNLRTRSEVTLAARQTSVTCPGRRLAPGPRVRAHYEWMDAEPVLIRLSMLRIDGIALGGVSGEVLTRIGLRWKRELPLEVPILITHANGSSGYLPDEASYATVGYEIQTAKVKPGCAEEVIVRGLSELAGYH